jgi:hypothetical protein
LRNVVLTQTYSIAAKVSGFRIASVLPTNGAELTNWSSIISPRLRRKRIELLLRRLKRLKRRLISVMRLLS